MLQSEKQLEDYICKHQEEFIEKLKGIYGEDEDIKFLGRQVQIGEKNIADLIYYYDNAHYENETFVFDTRTYIIVELKFRHLIAKDLAQLLRYINTLTYKLQSEKKYFKYETDVIGVFVSFGLDDDMQEISLTPLVTEKITFLNINTNITFEECNYSYKDEYIERLNLDNRLETFYEEVE